MPEAVTNVIQLLAWLAQRGDNYAAALSDPKSVRVAVNQEYARSRSGRMVTRSRSFRL